MNTFVFIEVITCITRSIPASTCYQNILWLTPQISRQALSIIIIHCYQKSEIQLLLPFPLPLFLPLNSAPALGFTGLFCKPVCITKMKGKKPPFLISALGWCFQDLWLKLLIIHQWLGYCWAVLAQCHSFLFFYLYPTLPQWVSGRGHNWDSWPELAKGIYHTVYNHAQQ